LRAASNRIALGLIIGALIIGSSQIITAGIQGDISYSVIPRSA